MKKILLVILVSLISIINVEAQSKSLQLNNNGGKSRTSSTSGKVTSVKPSSNANSIQRGQKVKPQVNKSVSNSKPIHTYRKDEDYTHNINSNTDNNSYTSTTTVECMNGVFTVGPNFQKTTDYAYMCRYINTDFARSFNTVNCVFPMVYTQNSRNIFLNVNPKLMALTNVTPDSMIVDISFFGMQYNNQLNSWTTNTLVTSVVLAPGETHYIYQYRKFYKMNVYTKNRSEENLINQYTGNCSPVNIYLSLTY